MTTKAGTNDWHGTGFYLGRYPWLSAEADRTRFSLNSQRQHMFGGTLGNPIIKNKLFNFFSLEYWKVGYPNSYVTTVPTALEAAGRLLAVLQHRRRPCGRFTIRGPPSSIRRPARSRYSRSRETRFPPNRFDPLTAILMKQFWAPNNPGDNITGVNNYKKGFIEKYNYYNWSERVDYNISDKWRAFGRVSHYYTDDLAGNPTPLQTTSLYVPTGSQRGAWQIAGDVDLDGSPRGP